MFPTVYTLAKFGTNAPALYAYYISKMVTQK